MKCPECKCGEIEISIHQNGIYQNGTTTNTIERPEGLYLWCYRCSLDYHAPDGLLHKRWKIGEYNG